MKAKYCKEFGNWGELQLDQWMSQSGWSPVEKNLKIHGGEIDRVYLKNGAEKSYFCVAEVKTNALLSEKSFFEIFSEIGIKKYLKQRQIRNLYRFGEQLLTKKDTNVFLRLFIVLKIKNNILINSALLPTKGPIKICCHEKDFFILSVEPEFTSVYARKSLLQIKV